VPGSPWRYRFYLDLDGHAASERVSAALAAIGAAVTDLRVLGTYARAGEG
jgi:chorismate mutase/prephenate dehydratase